MNSNRRLSLPPWATRQHTVIHPTGILVTEPPAAPKKRPMTQDKEDVSATDLLRAPSLRRSIVSAT